jgi:hypothetical protein
MDAQAAYVNVRKQCRDPLQQAKFRTFPTSIALRADLGEKAG